MSVFLAGVALGASLIVVIGPQNLMLINLGVRRQAVGLAVVICLLSDAILYVAGMLGMNGIVNAFPWALVVLKWVGVGFLLFLAVQAAMEALRPKDASISAAREVSSTERSWVGPVRSILAVTWLNPGSFLDTLVISGSVSNQYGTPGRWWFIAGALTASAIWFPLIGYGAAALSGPLSRPAVWRVLRLFIALILLAVAARLALS